MPISIKLSIFVVELVDIAINSLKRMGLTDHLALVELLHVNEAVKGNVRDDGAHPKVTWRH